jgi:hypothetical protein
MRRVFDGGGGVYWAATQAVRKRQDKGAAFAGVGATITTPLHTLAVLIAHDVDGVRVQQPAGY